MTEPNSSAVDGPTGTMSEVERELAGVLVECDLLEEAWPKASRAWTGGRESAGNRRTP